MADWLSRLSLAFGVPHEPLQLGLEELPMTERKMVAQPAQSVEADFGERTWTFRLGPEMMVAAGSFYIVPQEEYDLLRAQSPQ